MRARTLLRLWLYLALIVLTGGCAFPFKGIYRAGVEDGERIHYLSEGDPSFDIAIPGIDWRPSAVGPNHLLLTTDKNRKVVNVFEYREGLFSHRFYKDGAPDEEALAEYFRLESAYQTSLVPGAKGEIISRNIPDIPQPNLLWKIHGSTLPSIFFLTTSLNRRLVSVSWQDRETPDSGEKQLIDVFRSMKFLSPEEVQAMPAVRNRATLGRYGKQP